MRKSTEYGIRGFQKNTNDCETMPIHALDHAKITKALPIYCVEGRESTFRLVNLLPNRRFGAAHGRQPDTMCEEPVPCLLAATTRLHPVPKATESGQRDRCVGADDGFAKEKAVVEAIWGCKSVPTPDCFFSRCVAMGTTTLTIASRASQVRDYGRETQS